MSRQGTDLDQAVDCLRRGEIIAYPTEGVYGLGCDALDEGAVERLLELKQRPWEKGLIVIGASLPQLEPLLYPLTRMQRTRLEASWPAAVTWVVPAALDAPDWLTGGRDTIAVRVPDHEQARELCRRFRRPIVSTSANRAGSPPLRSVEEVAIQFGDQLAYLLEGEVGDQAGPSQMRDLRSGNIIRPESSDQQE